MGAKAASGLRRQLKRIIAPGIRRVIRRTLSPRTDRQPSSPVLQIDTPSNRSVVTGLLSIGGWAYSADARLPEGRIELAIDDERTGLELTNRRCVSGVDPDAQWAKRSGFTAAVNTFLLSNGDHRIRVRLKSQSGHIVCSRDIEIKVDNVGPLAETTTRLLKGYAGAKRVWTDVIDSGDFPYESTDIVAWFDQPDAESHIPKIMARHKLDSSYAAHLQHFVRDGYIVIDNFITKDWCERINRDLDGLIRSGTFRYECPGQRLEKLFEYSKATRDLWTHPEILKLLSAIYDDVALPCQTLNFIHGSQQDVHQDLVHLTPFPAGMMCGVWVALEDIHPDSGPLVVYPGSHRLPRLYTRTVPVEKVRDGDWRKFVSNYSSRLMELITQAGLKPVYYTPKTGSVLIWHETLAHGGSQRASDSITRKSMVSHYFARGGMAFYDSTGLPGWTHED